jgi:hypothetical protein
MCWIIILTIAVAVDRDDSTMSPFWFGQLLDATEEIREIDGERGSVHKQLCLHWYMVDPDSGMC